MHNLFEKQLPELNELKKFFNIKNSNIKIYSFISSDNKEHQIPRAFNFKDNIIFNNVLNSINSQVSLENIHNNFYRKFLSESFLQFNSTNHLFANSFSKYLFYLKFSYNQFYTHKKDINTSHFCLNQVVSKNLSLQIHKNISDNSYLYKHDKNTNNIITDKTKKDFYSFISFIASIDEHHAFSPLLNTKFLYYYSFPIFSDIEKYNIPKNVLNYIIENNEINNFINDLLFCDNEFFNFNMLLQYSNDLPTFNENACFSETLLQTMLMDMLHNSSHSYLLDFINYDPKIKDLLKSEEESFSDEQKDFFFNLKNLTHLVFPKTFSVIKPLYDDGIITKQEVLNKSLNEFNNINHSYNVDEKRFPFDLIELEISKHQSFIRNFLLNTSHTFYYMPINKKLSYFKDQSKFLLDLSKVFEKYDSIDSNLSIKDKFLKFLNIDDKLIAENDLTSIINFFYPLIREIQLENITNITQKNNKLKVKI